MTNRHQFDQLQALIAEAETGEPKDLDLWRERARAVLGRVYGDANHAEVSRFAETLVPGIFHSEQTLADGSFAAAQREAVGQGVSILKALQERLELSADDEADTSGEAGDPTVVFVVHGRNVAARDGVFEFLRALGLKPLEWSQAVVLTGAGSPYIGEVLDSAFEAAQAVVVLLTPDEITYLRHEFTTGDADPDYEPAPQARPNVLFEAGMAFGRHPERTILVEFGAVRPFSDVVGRHVVRLDGSAARRKEIAQRLETAGCSVDTTGEDWLTAGDLDPPLAPGNGLPLGRRVPTLGPTGVRLDARYVDAGKSGRLQITNYSSFAIHDLDFEVPPEAGPSFRVITDGPIAKLPAGKTASFIVSRSMGPGVDHFEISITGKTPDGEPVEVSAFIGLVG